MHLFHAEQSRSEPEAIEGDTRTVHIAVFGFDHRGRVAGGLQTAVHTRSMAPLGHRRRRLCHAVTELGAFVCCHTPRPVSLRRRPTQPGCDWLRLLSSGLVACSTDGQCRGTTRRSAWSTRCWAERPNPECGRNVGGTWATGAKAVVQASAPTCDHPHYNRTSIDSCLSRGTDAILLYHCCIRPVCSRGGAQASQ